MEDVGQDQESDLLLEDADDVASNSAESNELAETGLDEQAETAEQAEECENGCFLAGTPVLLGNGKTEEAINDVTVGDRVATDGGVANSPTGSKAVDPSATDVNQKTWREITITAEDWDVEVLEPLSWIKQNRVKDGSEEPLSEFVNVAEMGVPAGLDGTVDSIAACPKIQGGPGRVVLATVSHLNNDLYHLTLKNADGKTETLGVTGYHRFYDASIGWVHVQDMYSGETLRGADGNLTVVSLIRDPGTDRVYNMTVEADHVYYVGKLRALVHNTCFRQALADYTGQNPAGFDAHHVFPQALRAAFEDLGIDIDAPELGQWLQSGLHQEGSYAYQELWEDFLDENPNPSVNDLVEAAYDFTQQVFGADPW